MVLTGIMAQNTEFVITLAGLRAPPSFDKNYEFILNVYSSNNDKMIMYENIKTFITPATIRNSLSISKTAFSSDVKVNSIPSSETLNIEIILKTPVNDAKYSLEVDVPFNLSTLSSSSLQIVGGGICNSVITSSQYSIIDLKNTIYRIKFDPGAAFKQYNSALSSQICTLSIPKVQACSYVNYQGTVSARTSKFISGSEFGIDEGSQIFTDFKISSDPIIRQELSTTSLYDKVGRSDASYKFSFDINQPLAKDAFIIISYTERIIQFTNAVCSLVCSRSCNTNANCIIDKNNKYILLRSIFNTDFTDVSSTNINTMTINLDNVINPKSVMNDEINDNDNFKISVYYNLQLSNNHLVQSTDSKITQRTQFKDYKGILIQSLGVSTVNKTVRQYIDTMTLTFSFSDFALMENAKYEIQFPQINSFLMDSSKGSSTATWQGNSDSFNIDWDSTNNKIILQSSQSKQNDLGIVIKGGILNPPSTTKQHNIIMKITDTNNRLIAYTSPSSGVISVKNPDTNSLLTLDNRTSDKNSEKATYTFSITNPSNIDIQPNYQIIMTMPTYQNIPLQVTSCSQGTTQVSPCQINQNEVIMNILSPSSTGKLNFKMEIQNYISTEVVNFKALITENNRNYEIYSTSTNVQNREPATIDFLGEPNELESDIQVTWTFTLKQPAFDIPINSKIIVIFPSEFTVSMLANASISCSGPCSDQTINQREISVVTQTKNINTIQISKIFNPGPYIVQSGKIIINIKDQKNIDIASSITSTSPDVRFVKKCSKLCRTCEKADLTKCTTCYTDKSIQNNQCVDKCNDGYYSAPNSRICSPCTNNCLTCNSSTECITCQDKFIFVPDTKQCVERCDLLESYYFSNSQCLKCKPACQKCTSSEQCQSCRSGFYFVVGQEKCVSADGCNALGLFLKRNECVPCETPCAQCQTSYNSCLSCLDNQEYKFLQGKTCQKQCNIGFYTDGGNKCQQCDSLCSACSGSPRNCSDCIPSAGYFENKCYNPCPENVPLNLNGKCTSCPDGCSTCSSQDKCLTCKGSFLLYKNNCVKECPDNYEMDETQTKCVLKGIVEILSKNLQQSKFVPFPYLIALFIWIAVVLCSRNRAPETFVFGCFVGIGSVIEFATWITFFSLQTINDHFNTQYNKLFLAALVLHFLFNLINLIFFFIYIRKDHHFIYWVSQFQNKICHGFIRFFSFVFTHKFENFIYSKFFGFTFFSAKLSSVGLFLQYNILSGLSLLFVSVPMIVSASATCYFDDIFQQMFIEGLEVIIISVIMMGFQIANIKKPQDFFLQKTADGVNPLQMSSNIDPNPLQSRMYASYARTNFGGAESDRPEFKFSNKVSVIGELEKPLTFGYKPNNQTSGNGFANNMNNSYLNTQNGKLEVTANDCSIDFMNQTATKQNFNKNQELQMQGSVYGNNDQYLLNSNSIHSTQELGEVFVKGKRNFETKQMPRLNSDRHQAIEEQFEDDDEYGQENFSKLQMTGEDQMKRTEHMNQNSNFSNNQYQTMRSARSLNGGRMNPQMNSYNQSSHKQALSSSRPPSYVMDNAKTEKKLSNRNNGGSNSNLQYISPKNNQRNGKYTPKRDISIGVNEQDQLESDILPSSNMNQKSGTYDKKIGNRSTKEQSYMSPVKSSQNNKELNFQNNVSARSRSKSISPQKNSQDRDDAIYNKMNIMRSKSKERSDFEDEENQSQNQEYRNGQSYDGNSRINSRLGVNQDEFNLLRDSSYANRQSSQIIQKVGSDDTENDDDSPNKEKKHQQLFYLQNPMEGNQEREDSSRVQQIQTKVENLDTNNFDPYGLSREAAEKAKKMRRPSNQNSQPALDRKDLIKNRFENDGYNDIESERLDDRKDQPPTNNPHRMIAPPIIPGETIHSNNSPPTNSKSKRLQGNSSQKQLSESHSGNENKNYIKPPLRPIINNSGGKYNNHDSDEDENILDQMNQKRNRYDNDQDKKKPMTLLIRQNGNSTDNINSQSDQTGRLALQQVRVVTPMTTMINRDGQELQSNTQPIYQGSDYHNKSQNPNESFNKYTDISAAKTDNMDFHPVNLDEFGGGQSHQQSMNQINNQQSNSGMGQIFKDYSTISAINPINQNSSNLGNPSTGDLRNNYFGLSGKENGEFNMNNQNGFNKTSSSHSKKGNAFIQNPPTNNKAKQRRDVDDIFDSQESIRTASEAQMDFNEISPSDFNVLNQRYEEDLIVENNQKSQQLTKNVSQTPSYYDATNDQDEKMLIQSGDASLPPNLKNGRKSESIISQGQNYQKGLHAHSNTNSIASINQYHHNYMNQNHPIIINNMHNPSDNGTKRDNIRHLNDSRSASRNGNIETLSENHTPSYNNYNLNNGNSHFNLNQLTSMPTHHMTSQADESLIDLGQDEYDQDRKKSNPQLSKNLIERQSSSNLPQDSGNRSNLKTPSKLEQSDKLKNIEKIYLSRIENSILKSKNNSQIKKGGTKKPTQTSNTKPKNLSQTPNRLAKDTNDALFINDKNDYQDIDF